MSWLLNLWRRVRRTMPIGKNVLKIEEVKIQGGKGVNNTSDGRYKRGRVNDPALYTLLLIQQLTFVSQNIRPLERRINQHGLPPFRDLPFKNRYIIDRTFPEPVYSNELPDLTFLHPSPLYFNLTQPFHLRPLSWSF